MCSYNRINGTQTCESKALLDTLKHDWGFNGFVAPDFASAVRDGLAAANAGVDLPAIPGDFTGGLRTWEMFTSGQITPARLDDMVRRILFAMFDSGVYDDPVPATPTPVVSTPAHKDLATRISESGMVLLKNDDHALPLGARHLRSLAVIGPSGDDAMYINGGSAAVPVTAGVAVTLRAGICRARRRRREAERRAGVARRLAAAHHGAERRPRPGVGHGARAARPLLEQRRPAGRGDAHPDRSDRRRRGRARRPRPGLVGALDRHADAAGDRPVPADAARGGDREALRRRPPGHVGLSRGHAVRRRAPVPGEREGVAVLQAWYPGQQFGTALAAVLFGDSDPGGRLPVTFPADDRQGPAPPTRPERYPGVNGDQRYDEGLLVGYRCYDRVGQRPLFPFGYGLSYASFRLSGLDVDVGRRAVDVALRVKNTSRRAGSEVVQLYVATPAAAGEPPKQLKGYRKVALQPGESRRVRLRVRRDDLAVFDGGWIVPRGRYTALVGTSSRDLPLRRGFFAG
jgi:beta-glucosidase